LYSRKIKDEVDCYETKDDRSLPETPSQTEIVRCSTSVKENHDFVKIPNDYIQLELSNLYLSLKEFKSKPQSGYPKFKSRKYDQWVYNL